MKFNNGNIHFVIAHRSKLCFHHSENLIMNGA
jgi:hypothetical protein